MTEVAPSTAVASQTLRQLLTRQSVEFVKSDEASGKKNKKSDEDETKVGSPMKQTRMTTTTENAWRDDEGSTPRLSRAAATAPAGIFDSNGDDDTAPWFTALLQKNIRRDESDEKSDEDGDEDDDAGALREKRRQRKAYVDSLVRPTSISPPPDGSEFTTNWFSHNQPALLRLFKSLGWAGTTGSRPKHVIEIGCWEGRSSQWLLTTLCRRRGSTLTCIDTWQGGVQYQDIGLDLDGKDHAADAVERRFHENVKLVTGADPESDSVDNPVRKVKGRSTEVLASLMTENEGCGKFDLAYVDGSHLARDVMSDGIMCWELLRRGGVMVFDDYAWDQVMEHLPPKKCPRMAIDAFLAMFKDELLVLELGYQCVVQKIVMPK